jgi:hypothetical protein
MDAWLVRKRPPEGEITDRIEGRASDKDQIELRVARNLITRLNDLGACWQPPELLRVGHREERGVDCTARDDVGNELLIQVTTTDPEVWARPARDPFIVRGGVANATVVEAIRAAIEHKATRAAPDILLALDATDSPRAAFRSVGESFRGQHGEWAGVWVPRSLACRSRHMASDFLRRRDESMRCGMRQVRTAAAPNVRFSRR